MRAREGNQQGEGGGRCGNTKKASTKTVSRARGLDKYTAVRGAAHSGAARRCPGVSWSVVPSIRKDVVVVVYDVVEGTVHRTCCVIVVVVIRQRSGTARRDVSPAGHDGRRAQHPHVAFRLGRHEARPARAEAHELAHVGRRDVARRGAARREYPIRMRRAVRCEHAPLRRPQLGSAAPGAVVHRTKDVPYGDVAAHRHNDDRGRERRDDDGERRHVRRLRHSGERLPVVLVARGEPLRARRGDRVRADGPENARCTVRREQVVQRDRVRGERRKREVCVRRARVDERRRLACRPLRAVHAVGCRL